ncbi:MAG: glycoside hydrolase family 75 protein [Bacillota bacterium]|nr:glycoside hydrolase family 75 protein [Bacillota bacterium]
MLYFVQPYDSLYLISLRFNIPIWEIIRANSLINGIIYIGQPLFIPEKLYNKYFRMENTKELEISNNIQKVNSVYDTGLNKEIIVWNIASKNKVIFYFSKIAVTADGAPDAYHANNDIGLDFKQNAGEDGNWWGLVTDTGTPTGNPLIQKNGTTKGYYISTTYLSDCSKSEDDPERYVNSRTIPYITLPSHKLMGAKLGDIAAVLNIRNGKIAYAEVADLGPDNELGIGSMALADDLGIDSNPKSGGMPDGVMYIIFTQSGEGPCNPRTVNEIKREGKRLFEEWGGKDQIESIKNTKPELFEVEYSV